MTYEQALNFDQKWTAKQAFNDLERYLLRQEPPAMKAVALGIPAGFWIRYEAGYREKLVMVEKENRGEQNVE